MVRTKVHFKSSGGNAFHRVHDQKPIYFYNQRGEASDSIMRRFDDLEDLQCRFKHAMMIGPELLFYCIDMCQWNLEILTVEPEPPQARLRIYGISETYRVRF